MSPEVTGATHTDQVRQVAGVPIVGDPLHVMHFKPASRPAVPAAPAVPIDPPSASFPSLKQHELKAFGEYRTSRYVLQAFDQLARGNAPSQPAAFA